MKICWDTLEKVSYSKKTERFFMKNNTLVYNEACENCGEPYFGRGRFCSCKCSKQGEYHNKLNSKHTEETKKKISLAVKSSWKNMPNIEKEKRIEKSLEKSLYKRAKEIRQQTIQKYIDEGYSEQEIFHMYWYYSDSVRKITEKNYRKYRYIINPYNYKRGKDYHLDHMLSIRDGFSDNIDPYIIAHPANLRIVSAKENMVKNKNSILTENELREKINELYVKSV